jgi:hypothetical protein
VATGDNILRCFSKLDLAGATTLTFGKTNKIAMWTILEIAIEFTVAWSSWRLWLCIILAIGIVIGAFYKFPDHNGFWPLTSLIGTIVIAFGAWWHWRSER